MPVGIVQPIAGDEFDDACRGGGSYPLSEQLPRPYIRMAVLGVITLSFPSPTLMRRDERPLAKALNPQYQAAMSSSTSIDAL